MQCSVAVVLLNYRGAADTLACVDSLSASTQPIKYLIIVDNASPDDSWAELCAGLKLREEQLRAVWSQWGAGVGPFRVLHVDAGAPSYGDIQPSSVTLIRNTSNAGFAAGNNVGIRLALRDEGVQAVWLLNNDTEVDARALEHLVVASSTDPDVGLWGSTVLYFGDRGLVQALGGGVVSTSGDTRHVGAFTHRGNKGIAPDIAEQAESSLHYILGASMFATRPWLSLVGLLNERYFLYYEELDWATRGKKLFKLGYAPESLVFHKEGATIGTAPSGGSTLSIFHLNRSKVLFARQYMSTRHVAYVVAYSVYRALKFALKGRLRAAGAVIAGLGSGVRA